MNPRLHIAAAWLLVTSLALPGCAPLSASLGSSERRSRSADVEIRPDAPPEYDLLVAQQHAIEGRMAEAVAAYQRAVAKDEQSAYLHRKVAGALARQNRLVDALHHAERARELEPDDPDTAVFLGQLYRLRRDVPAVEAVLLDENAAPIGQDAAHLLYQAYLESGRLDDALRTAEWMIADDPDSLRGRVAVANAYQRMGKPVEAERQLREALEVDPGSLRIYNTLARSLRDRGNHEAEIDVYDEMLEIYPRHLQTLVALGEAQMALNDLEGAIATFEQIERDYPDDMRSIVRLGFLQYESREFAEAAERFERALELKSDEYEIAFFLGIVLRRAGDSDAAMEAFARIPSDHKHYAEARTQLAAILERRGDFEGALREIELAMRANPSRALDLYRATLRSKTGDFDGAVAHLERMLEENPQDDELLYNLGVVYGEAKEFDEAISYMELALEENPDNASALNYIGYTWAERGIHLDEAESMITRAVDLRPDDGYIADSMGWVYYMRAAQLAEAGESSEAHQYLQRALRELERADELTGGDPVVSEHLGDLYLQLNQKQRALDRFEEALRLEPRHGEQPNLLEKFEALQRELR